MIIFPKSCYCIVNVVIKVCVLKIIFRKIVFGKYHLFAYEDSDFFAIVLENEYTTKESFF